MLIETVVDDDESVEVMTADACVAVWLPRTYPVDDMGAPVKWGVCHPIAQLPGPTVRAGIACSSAADTAPPEGEEMAWFQRRRRLERRTFVDWYGSIDWSEGSGDR